MSWTTAADLRAQTQRLWDKGRVLAAVVEPAGAFPCRLSLKAPSSDELSARFDEVRTWSAALRASARPIQASGVRLVSREVRHRVIGSNALPAEAWLDTVDDALAVIGKQRDGRRFKGLLESTRAAEPSLLRWLQTNPLRALALESGWSRLLTVIAWLRSHPAPSVYLRQIDLAGVHSKFIEEHRVVMAELLDLALPESAIDRSSSGPANFSRRYGFRSRPGRVRLRVLDPRCAVLDAAGEQDIEMNAELFARLDPDVAQIFLTENEINFLAFPAVPDSWVIFGGGYGFEALASAGWMRDKAVHYWGDIDTHGFAILDQLRARLPHVSSLLMDRGTLLQHRSQWVDEPTPVLRDLDHLLADERAVYDDLRWKRLGDARVRLEQERVGFGWVEAALRILGKVQRPTS